MIIQLLSGQPTPREDHRPSIGFGWRTALAAGAYSIAAIALSGGLIVAAGALLHALGTPLR